VARVLITGCGSGFGKLTALEFGQRGHQVFATCRTAGSAEQLAAEAYAIEGIQTFTLDVTDQAAIDRTIRGILARAESIDVLVNNAGIAHPGALEDLDPAAFRRVMETNFFGAVWMTRAVLPAMRAQGSGRIIMVSSLSALVGLPGESVYAASKAALEAAAESLRYEVDRFGIAVSVIEPGAFDTDMPHRIAATGAGEVGSPYAPLIAQLTERARRNLGSGDDPQRVAELICEVAEAEQPGFRYPAGAQAEQVVATLAALPEAQRAAFIRAVNETEWWSRGDPEPPGAGLE
jgi:NAD(P)-dependent dehydrogenase (short-subunit alcohol dehydrogenase family)